MIDINTNHVGHVAGPGKYTFPTTMQSSAVIVEVLVTTVARTNRVVLAAEPAVSPQEYSDYKITQRVDCIWASFPGLPPRRVAMYEV